MASVYGISRVSNVVDFSQILSVTKKEIQLDATQWFIELMICSTCFEHYYAHHQELETIQIFTACDT